MRFGGRRKEIWRETERELAGNFVRYLHVAHSHAMFFAIGHQRLRSADHRDTLPLPIIIIVIVVDGDVIPQRQIIIL
jgi:hypothetical protein